MTFSAESPGRFPVSIDGRTYVSDLEGYQRRSLDLIRQQADSSPETGEQSLNPEDLWRRSQRDWRYGAGLQYLDKDRPDSLDRRRFLSSRNIDPWSEGRLTLLRRPYDLGVAAATYRMAVAGTRLYLADVGSLTLRWITEFDEPDTWAAPASSSLTLPVGATISDVCSDGYNIYIATALGVYATTRDTAVASKINDLVANRIAFVRGRLMASAAATQHLYNITDTSVTTTPAALTASDINTDFRWECFAASKKHIYAAGYSGDKATIYRVAITDDATALGPPVASADLPAGEVVYSMLGYVGVLIIGTSLGVRVAAISEDGDLEYGPLIEIGEAVKSLAAWGSYVWFGWRNHDGAGLFEPKTSLGRLDLSSFTEPLLPAFASDVTTDDADVDIESIVAFADSIVYSTTSIGASYVSTKKYADEGTLNMAYSTFGVPDLKTSNLGQARFHPLPGTSVKLTVVVDEPQATVYPGDTTYPGSETYLTSYTATYNATQDEQNTVTLEARPDGDEPLGDTIQGRITLWPNTNLTATPTVTQLSLYANPIPRRGRRQVIPVLLYSTVLDGNGNNVEYVPLDELAALEALEEAGRPIDVELFGTQERSVIDAVQWGPELTYGPSGGPEGRCFVVIRSFTQ